MKRDIMEIRCLDCGSHWPAKMLFDDDVDCVEFAREKDSICPECESDNVEAVGPWHREDVE